MHRQNPAVFDGLANDDVAQNHGSAQSEKCHGLRFSWSESKYRTTSVRISFARKHKHGVRCGPELVRPHDDVPSSSDALYEPQPALRRWQMSVVRSTERYTTTRLDHTAAPTAANRCCQAVRCISATTRRDPTASHCSADGFVAGWLLTPIFVCGSHTRTGLGQLPDEASWQTAKFQLSRGSGHQNEGVIGSCPLVGSCMIRPAPGCFLRCGLSSPLTGHGQAPRLRGRRRGVDVPTCRAVRLLCRPCRWGMPVID
jgi:hypothetical protein